jgi:signal transduction histidine kinase/signal recognition particle receptor subunit beta
MVQFDNQHRQVKIKIVYYGPAVGGKTTCLQYIHRTIDPQRRTKLYSLNTAADRTLFFDLLSLNLGRIRGYQLALQVFTVPGQVQYDATRRTVLAGADGVVFVADSQVEQRQANVDSLENLWQNLESNGIDRRTVPLVLQYNKRDLENIMSPEEMDAALNGSGYPALPTVAITGDGILEAFTTIGERTLTSVADKLGVGTNPQAVERLREQMRIAMRPYMETEGEPSAPVDVEVTVPAPGVDPDAVMGEEALVGEAVRANLTMTDLNSRLDALSRQLERKVRVMDSISGFGHAVSNQRDPAKVLRLLITETIRLLQVQGASVIIIPGAGKPREAVVHGFKRDPLLSTADETGEMAAINVLDGQKPRLLVREIDGEDDGSLMSIVENAGFSSAIVVPLVTQEKMIGLLAAYGDNERADLDEDDLQLATVLGSTAAMGYANAIAWRQMQDASRGLESQIEERTVELRKTLAESRRLAEEVAEKKNLLEEAYRDLEALDEVKNQLLSRLSGELRAPVSSLVTAAKILQRDRDADAEKRDRFVSIIRQESDKLLDTIQSIFQASVLAGRGDGPDKAAVPAQDLIRRALAPLRDFAKDRRVSLQVLIPNDLDTISCHADSTEAALRAVIKNAIQFNRSGGEVKLEVRRVVRGNEPWLQLRVRDTGVGIDEKDLAHVREAFWQGENSSDSEHHGIGLGLAIADRVTVNHGGEISIKSTLHEGTEVVMTFPQTG